METCRNFEVGSVNNKKQFQKKNPASALDTALL